MADLTSTWKDIVKTVAPLLGTALGGPLGGMATKAIATAVLGEDKADASVKDIATAIAGGGPEILSKIRQAENDFAVKMEELGIKREEIAAQDRASAREREVRTADKTPRNLAYITLIGFFLVLAGQFVVGFSFSDKNLEFPQSAQRMLDITTGVLFAMVLAVKDYYFGSSSGSKAKTDILAGMQERSPASAGSPAPTPGPQPAPRTGSGESSAVG